MPQEAVLESHLLVARFLEHYGYMDTLASFRREAGRLAHRLSDQPAGTATTASSMSSGSTTENPTLTELATHLSSLQLTSTNELPPGNLEFYTDLVNTFPQLHTTNILATCVEPASSVVATSGTDKTVKLHLLACLLSPLATRTSITERVYRHHQAPVLSIDFHPIYSHIMLTASMDGTAVLVDTSSSQNGNLDSEDRKEEEEDEDEEQVDEKEKDVVQRFRDHQRYVVRGLFSPNNGQYMATASYDRTICIYKNKAATDNSSTSRNNLPQYELEGRVGPFLGNIETICFVPSATTSGHGDDDNSAILLIAGVQNDNYLHVISMGGDAQTPYETAKINMNANGDSWVSFSPVWLSISPTTPSLLLISTDHASGRMILMDIGTAAATATGALVAGSTTANSNTSSGAGAASITVHVARQIQNYYVVPCDNKFITRRHVFHPSGLYFYVIGGEDNQTVKVVETSSGHLEATLAGGHQAMIRSISLDPVTGALFTAGFDHTVAIWSKKTTAQLYADCSSDLPIMR